MTTEEELAETQAALDRVSDYVRECCELVDALFPQDEHLRKPPTNGPANRGQMWMHSSQRGADEENARDGGPT